MALAARTIDNTPSEVSRGIALMVAGALFIPFLDALAKILVTRHGISAGEVSLVRLVQQAAFMAPLLFLAQGRAGFRIRRPALNLLRGVLLGLGGIFFFAALRSMPLADTTAIFFVEPMIVTILSALVLGETIGWRRALAVAVGFGGAMIVIRPSFVELGPVSALPVACAFCIAAYSILSRKLSDTGSVFAMHFYGGVGGTLALGVVMAVGHPLGVEELSFSMPDEPVVWVLFLATGLVGLVGHLLFVQAFRLAPASTLAPFAYGEIVSAVILGYVLFGDFPDPLKWLGIAIIVASGAYIFERERRVARAASQAAPEALVR